MTDLHCELNYEWTMLKFLCHDLVNFGSAFTTLERCEARDICNLCHKRGKHENKKLVQAQENTKQLCQARENERPVPSAQARGNVRKLLSAGKCVTVLSA